MTELPMDEQALLIATSELSEEEFAAWVAEVERENDIMEKEAATIAPWRETLRDCDD